MCHVSGFHVKVQCSHCCVCYLSAATELKSYWELRGSRLISLNHQARETFTENATRKNFQENLPTSPFSLWIKSFNNNNKKKKMHGCNFKIEQNIVHMEILCCMSAGAKIITRCSRAPHYRGIQRDTKKMIIRVQKSMETNLYWKYCYFLYVYVVLQKNKTKRNVMRVSVWVCVCATRVTD